MATKKAPPKKPAPTVLASSVPRRQRAIPVPRVDLRDALVPAGGDPVQPSREYLRYAAVLRYTTDLNGISVTDLGKEDLFSVVPAGTLQRWMYEDRWTEKRNAVMERWRGQIEAKLGDELVQRRLESFRQVKMIKDGLIERLKESLLSKFADMSTKDAVDSLAKLLKLEFDMGVAVLHDAMPTLTMQHATVRVQAVPGVTTTPLAAPSLSQEEARAAAVAVIRARRAKITAAMPKDDDGPVQPK